MTPIITSVQKLDDRDLNLWLKIAIAQLKSGKSQDLDISKDG
jgi:hypothetical protein